MSQLQPVIPPQFDVIFYDEVGIPFDPSTPKKTGMGASEHQVIMLADAMATRHNLKVLVLNNLPMPVWQKEGTPAGRVLYMPRAFAHTKGLSCKLLVVTRYSNHPPIKHDRKVIWTTDNPAGGSHEHHWPELAKGAEIVALSSWHRDQFPRQWYSRINVIPLMVPDELKPMPIRGDHLKRFVYASAPLKGLNETLLMWRSMAAETADCELRVCAPAYDIERLKKIQSVEERREGETCGRITFLGSLPFEKVVTEILDSAGLFYVNTFPETFCLTAALAEHCGRRLHILASNLAGMVDAVSAPLMTRDEDDFVGYFKDALLEPQSPYFYGMPRNVKVKHVLPEWMEYLEPLAVNRWLDDVDLWGVNFPDRPFSEILMERAVQRQVDEAMAAPPLPTPTFSIELGPNNRIEVPLPRDLQHPPAPASGTRGRLAAAMILRDEAKTVTRALASLLPLIDGVAAYIDDRTTDDTEGVIREFCLKHNLDVAIARGPFENYAAARNHSLELARNIAGRAFVIDADDFVTIVDPGTRREFDEYDVIDLVVHEEKVGGDTHLRGHIISVGDPRWPLTGFCYEWPVHESLVWKGAQPPRRGTAPWIMYHRHPGGARQRDAGAFVKEANLIATWLMDHPDDTRMRYYLGQSWWDAANRTSAAGDEVLADRYRRAGVAAWLVCADRNGWVQERYVALWKAGRLLEQLAERDPDGRQLVDQAVGLYLRARELDPRRGEVLFELARLHGQRRQFHACELFAAEAAAKTNSPPEDALFADRDRCDFLVREWLAVAWANTGQCQLAIGLFVALLNDIESGKAPREHWTRIAANLAFAQGQIDAKAGMQRAVEGAVKATLAEDTSDMADVPF